MPGIFFVRTPQTKIPNQFPLVYGGYAESVDAEDDRAWSFSRGGGIDPDSDLE